jgi:8-oxo-dGTP pyrophosphatase MutT (NUDIX family)
MHHATLCYVFEHSNPKDVKVLLGMKKKGFGEGRLNGYGGKVEKDESYVSAAIRETAEEAKIEVHDLEKVGELDFKFTNAPPGKDWDQVVHVYIAKHWKGTPVETDEMKPEWFSVNKLLDSKDEIYKKFWDDDKYWFPEVLKGKKIYGWFVFGKDNAGAESVKLEETKSFKR